MNNSTKKVCVISGGSRGIGLAISKMMAQRGYNLATFSRTQAQLDQYRNKMESLGTNVIAMCGDGASINFLKDFIEHVVNKFGQIDVLINNAGWFPRYTIEDISIEDWDQCLNINLRAPMILSKLCLPYLKKHKESAIINMASVAGKMGFAYGGAYCASKHGLMGLTECLFEEVREQGVKVTAICPGFVQTEMVSGSSRVDENKMIKADDIAKTVAYILDLSQRACPSEITVRPQYSPYK